MTVLLERRGLSLALLSLDPLLLLLLGLRGGGELLRYLLLGDQLGDRARLPVRGRERELEGRRGEDGSS